MKYNKNDFYPTLQQDIVLTNPPRNTVAAQDLTIGPTLSWRSLILSWLLFLLFWAWSTFSWFAKLFVFTFLEDFGSFEQEQQDSIWIKRFILKNKLIKTRYSSGWLRCDAFFIHIFSELPCLLTIALKPSTVKIIWNSVKMSYKIKIGRAVPSSCKTQLNGTWYNAV